MIKNIIILLAATFGLLNTTLADDFVASPNQPNKMNCKIVNSAVQFADNTSLYNFYEKKISSTQLHNCEKIKIKDQSFYTVMYSTQINELGSNQKVLIYEVVSINAKTKLLQTVRSEVVDQVDLSGDAVEQKFENSITTQWGQAKKEASILLKLTILNKNEKPFSYLLKYNPSTQWFINIF